MELILFYGALDITLGVKSGTLPGVKLFVNLFTISSCILYSKLFK